MRDLSGQEGIFPLADIRRYPIELVGAGGIGSWLALMLAWEGFEPLTVWDFDAVGPENTGQAYWQEHLGQPKVVALADLIRRAVGTEIFARHERFTDRSVPHGILIAAVDSMEQRRVIWDRAKRNPAVPLFIDARMGGESGMIYTINPQDGRQVDFYEARFYPDAQAAAIPCTERGIVHTQWILNGHVGRQLKWFLTGERFAHEIHFDLASDSWFARDFRGQVLAITNHSEG